VLASIPLSAQVHYAENMPLEHSAIRYAETAPQDVVSRLKDTTPIQNIGQLLARLSINPDSQTLVFSKTSIQASLISPNNPRAVYFNDQVAVGYVRGSSLVEVADLDARGGTQFYALDLKAARPVFARQTTCLRCHQGAATQGVPGMFVGSVYADRMGNAAKAGAIITDHRSLFTDRWGGWYMNAKQGVPLTRANAIAANPAVPETLDTRVASPLFGSSDVVALMTLEHQTQAANLITRLGWLVRMAAPDIEVNTAVSEMARYFLFADEAPLATPIVGASTFSKTFPQQGPRDHRGRSLRDFDLNTRMFRYRLSYMIYSPAFDGLPALARQKVYEKLRVSHIPELERSAIAEILMETKPEAAGYFK
jgi:hypothetical protein